MSENTCSCGYFGCTECMNAPTTPITLRQRINRWWWGVYKMDAENRRLARLRLM